MAAGPTVARIVAVGSWLAWRVGVLQLAVFVFVSLAMITLYEVRLMVRSALVVVVSTGRGVTVLVGVTVVDGLVTVLGSNTVTTVCVVVAVAAKLY